MIAMRLTIAAVLAAVLALTTAVDPSHAEAQPATTTTDQVDATPKGTIGLGMIGAELGFAVPAVAGLHDTWAFIVFPIVGAAGGALAGWYGIDDKDSEEAAVGVLAGGMALIVPTMVLTLSMTAYDPSDEADVVQPSEQGRAPPPEQEATEEPPTARGVSPERVAAMRRRVEMARAGGGMFRLSERGLHLGVPALAVAPSYSAEQVAKYGVDQQAELRVPLFTGVF